ncbi:MAG: hypothetical protein AAF497_03140 [Planctomycetota bacterium]
MSIWPEMILSSYPDSILDREKAGKYQGNSQRWAKELEDASGSISVEEAANRLEIRLWLDIAAQARAMQILSGQKQNLQPLLSSDLKSNDARRIARAGNIVGRLGWTDFHPVMLGLLVNAEDKHVRQVVYNALLFSQKPVELPALLSIVRDDPSSIAIISGLFQSTLYEKNAPQELKNLLDAEDTFIRWHAANAIRECRDPELSNFAIRCAIDPESRYREIAVGLANRLMPRDFDALKLTMRKLCRDRDAGIRSQAIACLARKKDLWVGEMIVELLRDKDVDLGKRVTVMQSFAALAGTHFGYDMHRWGVDNAENMVAVEKLQAWLRSESSEP